MNFQLLRNMYAWCIHYLYLFVCRFIKRLVYFFKPTNHLFSRQEFTNERSQKIAHVGCLLIDYLISSERVSNIFLHIYSSPKQINITSYIFYVHTLITQFFLFLYIQFKTKFDWNGHLFPQKKLYNSLALNPRRLP